MSFTPIEFTKGNETRTADSAAAAVALRFDGWAEKDDKSTPAKKS